MNTSETKKTNAAWTAFKRWMNDHNIIYAVIVLAIILICVTDKFLTVNNIMNIFRQTSMVAILAIGAFYTIVGGGIDLSNGSLAGLCGIMFAKFVAEWGINPVIGIILTLIFGMIMGAVNAGTIAYGGIPPFIATLGLQIAARGLCFVITNAYPVIGIPENVVMIGTGYIWFIPIPVIITIVVFIIMSFIAQKTRYGRSVYAVGSNEDASHFSGIDTKKVKAGTYVISGLMSAIAAIGGVSISGGKGNLLGVFIGALFVGMLTNGMTLIDMNSYYQQIVEGVVLILAIGIDSFRTARANKV